MNPRPTALLPLCVCVSVCVAGDRERDNAKWLRQLGSTSFIQRDFAARQLVSSTDSPVGQLITIVRSDDLTASVAALDVLSQLAMSDQPAGAEAHRALTTLATVAKSLRQPVGEQVIAFRGRADRRVAGIIAAFDGTVTRNDRGHVVGVQIHHQEFGDRDAAILSRFAKLTTLDLRNTRITDVSLDTVASLTELEELNLADTAVAPDGIRRLTPLQNLTKLVVHRIPFNQDDLRWMATQFPNCEIRP